MAARIKMPVGMELGLVPGDFVLDGEPLPLLKKGADRPYFRRMFIVAKRLDGSRLCMKRFFILETTLLSNNLYQSRLHTLRF